MQIKFNEETWYSKLAAVILFLGFIPVFAFYIGTQYQETRNIPTTLSTNSIQAPTTSSGWKTYQNKQYGFEVGYPANYVYEESPDGVALVSFYNPSWTASEGLGTKIYLKHANFPTFEAFVADMKANYILGLVRANGRDLTDQEARQEVDKLAGRYSFEVKKTNNADVLIHERDFFGVFDGASETYLWLGEGNYINIYGYDLDIDSFQLVR